MAKDKKQSEDMSLEEAKAYRASLAKPKEKVLSEQEKREEFRMFWTKEKSKYGKSKEIEPILWIHLKSIGMDEPAKFAEGVAHFGFKKIK